MKKILAYTLFIASAMNAPAALTSYEGFDYTNPSSLNGSSGGTGFSGSWVTSSNPTVSSPLAFSNLQTNGNGAAAGVATSNDTDYRSFANRGGTDTWISFIYRRESSGNPNGYTGLAFGQGSASMDNISGSSGLFFGQWGPVSGIVMGPNDQQGIGRSLGGGIPGTSYFVVIELDYGDANGGTMRGYLNPIPGAVSPGAPSNSVPFTLPTLDRVGFETSSDDLMRVDEIRIGDSYADVSPVPEPGSIVGLATAGGLLLGRRRRKA